MLNYFWVLLISMIPVVELRGSIPFGLYGLWPITEKLDVIPVTVLAVIGNLIPIPFLILFGGKVLRYFASFEKFGKPFRKIIEIGEKKVAKMQKSAQRALFWGLFAFVAIPLPGTGAWTGALISITLGLDLKKSVPPIALGVLGAGSIILGLFYFAPELFGLLVG
jgi:uncharacterized membrane protein